MTMMLMSINSSSLSSMVPPPYKRIRFHFLRREDLYIYGAAAAFNLLLAIIQGFRHLTSAYGFTSYVYLRQNFCCYLQHPNTLGFA